MEIAITTTGSAKFQAALAKLSGEQAREAYRLGLRDAGFQARTAIQDEMRRQFDRPTPFIMKSVQVTLDANDLAVRIAPTYFGNQPVDPQQILQAQEFGGTRAPKRFEIVLRQVGLLPAGWFAVPGQGAKLDAYGNMSRGQLMQILSQLRAQTTAGYTRNMAGGKRGIAAQQKAGGRFFVAKPGGRIQPGVYQREFMGRNITPVLIFVAGASYRARLGMDRIANQSDLQEYFERRVRRHVYNAAEAA